MAKQIRVVENGVEKTVTDKTVKKIKLDREIDSRAMERLMTEKENDV